LLNFSAQDLTLNTGESGDGIIKLSTYLDREENVDFAQLSLRKHEGVIVESSGKGILPG
jgi:hypothetical protein